MRQPCVRRLPVPLERQEEALGDRMMVSFGFERWALSQARATQQTLGWPDRLYIHATRPLAVYWEAKRVGGRPRPAQLAFAAHCQRLGWHHVLGPSDALADWLVAQRLARRVGPGHLIGTTEAERGA
jgi:hypothetical protein